MIYPGILPFKPPAPPPVAPSSGADVTVPGALGKPAAVILPPRSCLGVIITAQKAKEKREKRIIEMLEKFMMLVFGSFDLVGFDCLMRFWNRTEF